MRALPMIASLLLSSAVAAAEFTDEVIGIAKLQGGLAVVIGCDDAQMAADLVTRGFVVQSLGDDGETVAEARQFLSSAGVQGQATASECDGKRLPYVDNLVNLLVLRDAESEQAVLRHG